MRVFPFRRGRNRAFTLGNRARDAGQWQAAVSHYQKAAAREPDNFSIWVQYGHALKESGDVPAGEAAYRKALALAPAVADTHLQIGHVLKQQGRLDQAAAAYLNALAIDPKLHLAALELFNLGWGIAAIDEAAVARPRQAARHKPPVRRRDGPAGAVRSIVFDVSDLIHYFLRARVPTGIQRVQMNVVVSLLRQPAPEFDLTIACFTPNSDYWIVVPEALFVAVTELAVAGGELDDPAWLAILNELYSVLAAGEPLQFRDGAVLINMGTSWSLQNYLLMVRAIKSDYRVRYIPFVHDCIPLLAPQHCTKGLTRDFTDWLIGAFLHADGFLVNSDATAADLADAARRLGHAAPQPAVIRLDACSAAGRPNGPEEAAGGEEIIARHRLDRSGFVLFVSTIEARKNHLLAFEAWLSLIGRRGVRHTPMLVCVGNPGWLAEAAMARLKSSALLRRRVQILSKISDAALAALYGRCLFTLYPSSYEGWGLPVTESLCFGKVPVIARISSLPEAGGNLAEYFDHRSAADLVETLERLLDDGAYRTAREAMIRAQFKPRRWRDIADAILAGVVAQPPAAAVPGLPLPAEIGRYYAMSRTLEAGDWSGRIGGEMYRMGRGWWAPSDWGTWLKAAEAEIAFSLGGPGTGALLFFLGLRGTPANTADYHVGLVGGATEQAGTLAAGEERWVRLVIPAERVEQAEFRVRLTTGGRCQLAEAAKGYTHLVTLGVIGFYLCRETDAPARDRFLEAMRTNGLTCFPAESEGSDQAADRAGPPAPPA